MASSSVKTKPAQIVVGDSVFVCSCGSKEFRSAGDPPNWFCRCGVVYTTKDIFPEEE